MQKRENRKRKWTANRLCYGARKKKSKGMMIRNVKCCRKAASSGVILTHFERWLVEGHIVDSTGNDWATLRGDWATYWGKSPI